MFRNIIFSNHPYQALWALLAMIVIFVVSNKLVTIPINDWLTYGAFTFPLVFLITDLSNRTLGPKKARIIAWVSLPFAGLISGYFAPWQIALASASAFICGQLLDITIFNRLRNINWWLAPWAGSMLASIVDTIIFFGIAFYEPSNPNWLTVAAQLGFGDLCIKWLMASILLAPYRLLIAYLPVWQMKTY